MIRKLKSGGYRLYSRKVNPKTSAAGISAPSRRAGRPRSTSALCNISSATEPEVARAPTNRGQTGAHCGCGSGTARSGE